jgi:hypothetical protein
MFLQKTPVKFVNDSMGIDIKTWSIVHVSNSKLYFHIQFLVAYLKKRKVQMNFENFERKAIQSISDDQFKYL